ncbi:MAG: sulfite exporter TauE/SafE family protein, partial [Myxococcales bacterium]|nr:sulfite exporter TauE/SafE family protein [Myxococcales bacterium]
VLDWSLLGTLVLLALAGSLHCAGMCGGFAAMVAARGPGRGLRVAPAMLSYVIGKAISYAILGSSLALLAGGVDARLHASDSADVAHAFQGVLAWFVGIALVVAGLAALGVRLPRRFGGIPAPIARVFEAVRDLPGLQGAFGVGVLTGLLPCGLSWSAFAVATSTDPATAAAGLFLFGLGTAPVLLGIGLLGSSVPLSLRRFGPWIVG